MTSLGRIVRPFIPIVAHTQETIVRVPVPVPVVGKRWGKPSDFEFELSDDALADGEKNNVAVYDLSKEIVVNGEEVWRKFDVIRYPNPRNLDQYVDVERLTEVVFFTGETEHVTEESIDENTVQPEREIRKNYVHFQFPLTNMEGQKVDDGERGTFPEEPPPPPKTLEDYIQESKDFWAQFMRG